MMLNDEGTINIDETVDEIVGMFVICPNESKINSDVKTHC